MWSLKPGARLTISTPGNHFELGRGHPEYLLLAGGIGITPIYSMALALAAGGRRFRLLYAGRTRAGSRASPTSCARAIGDRLARVRRRGGRAASTSPAEIAALAPGWRALCLRPDRPARGDEARLAGAAAGRWTRCASRPSATAGALRRGLHVKHPAAGPEIDVPRNQTMLDALEAAGVDMIFDCRRGECGLCALDDPGVRGRHRPPRRLLQRRRKGGERQALHLRLPRRGRQHHRRHGGPASHEHSYALCRAKLP